MNRFGLLTLFLGGLLFVSACEDYPQMVEYPVPQPTSAIGKALVEGTDQISVIYKDSTYTLHKGVEVTEMAYLSSEGRSIRTFWYKIDLSEPTINLECVTPYGTHTVGGNPEVLSKMLSHVDKEGNCVLGGTNTDFGGGLGPQGVYWSNGVVLKDKFTFLQDRPRCFVYIKDKTMGIGYESEYNRILADCGGSFDQAFCGSPRLIVDGKIDIDVPNDLDEASHPRTAIGIMPDRKTIYLMVVDGRRYTYSNGMYLQTLAENFLALGCSEALNLDGGGSSTFIVAKDGPYGDPARFNVRNWPNDNGGEERQLYNGLAIIANDK